jgi:hypothetical protein
MKIQYNKYNQIIRNLQKDDPILWILVNSQDKERHKVVTKGSRGVSRTSHIEISLNPS